MPTTLCTGIALNVLSDLFFSSYQTLLTVRFGMPRSIKSMGYLECRFHIVVRDELLWTSQAAGRRSKATESLLFQFAYRSFPSLVFTIGVC